MPETLSLHKRIAAILVLVAFLYQFLLPVWHHGHHTPDGIGAQLLHSDNPTVYSPPPCSHPDDEDCRVCHLLSWTGHQPGLLLTSFANDTIFPPTGKRLPVVDDQLVSRASLHPSQRAPPTFS